MAIMWNNESVGSSAAINYIVISILPTFTASVHTRHELNSAHLSLYIPQTVLVDGAGGKRE